MNTKKTNKNTHKASAAIPVAIIRWRPVNAETRSRQYGYGQKFAVWLSDGRQGLLRQDREGCAGDLILETDGDSYTLGQFAMPPDLRARLEGNIVTIAIRCSLNTMGAILTFDFLIRLTSALDKSYASANPGETESIGQALEASEVALRRFDCLMAALQGGDIGQFDTMLMDFASAVRGLRKRVSVLAKKPAGFRGKVTDRNVCEDDRVCDSLEDLLALKLDQAGRGRKWLVNALKDMGLLSSGVGKTMTGSAAMKRAPKSNRGRRTALQAEIG